MTDRENANVELREYVRALRRRWLWLVAPVVAAMGIAAGLTLTADPSYRSQTVLYVSTGTGDPDARATRINSYIALLTGPRVAESVIADLGLPMSTDAVRESITAQVQEGTDLLTVSATDSSAERSRSIVTTATAALLDLAEELDPPVPATGESPAGPSVSVAQEPVTTREPDNLARTVGFSGALGLLLGAAAVAVLQATRKTVNDEEDLRRLGLGPVGVISLGGRPGRDGYPNEALAEAFRRLRSLMPDPAGPAGGAGRGTSLLLTAPNPHEGTTAIACGLAVALAETGSSVVLVDANMRGPGVDRYLSVDTAPGLSDVLTGTAQVDDVLQDSLDGRLTVLPSGDRPADPGEALASPRLRATVRALTSRFDVVLVDAPALHAVADAAVLGRVTDRSLLVVRAGHSRAADVVSSAELLEKVGAQPAGAVLNALPRRLPSGAGWRSDRGMSVPAHDAELVAGLYGSPADDAEPDDTPDDDGNVVLISRTPVRGQAPVVQATVAGESGDDEQAPRAAARGRAAVVSITDAAPHVPAPRTPPADRLGTDDDEPASGD